MHVISSANLCKVFSSSLWDFSGLQEFPEAGTNLCKVFSSSFWDFSISMSALALACACGLLHAFLVVPTGTFGCPVGLRLDMSKVGVMMTSLCSGYFLVVGASAEVTSACGNVNINTFCCVCIPSACLLLHRLLLLIACLCQRVMTAACHQHV